MRLYFIAITVLIAAGAAYFAGKRLLAKRRSGLAQVSPPPSGKQGGEYEQPLTIEPARDAKHEIPIAEPTLPEHKPERDFGGQDTSGSSPTPVDAVDQQELDVVSIEAHFLEIQHIGQDTVAEEQDSPEPSPDESIQGEPATIEITSDGPQEYAAASAQSADGAPESASPGQAENIPPVSVEPLAETEKEGDDTSLATALELNESEPDKPGMQRVHEEPVLSEPVNAEANGEIDTEEEETVEGGGAGTDEAEPEGGGIALVTRKKRPRVPRRFRPTGRPPAQAGPGDKTKSGPVDPGVRDRALSIEVRVVIERGGHCRVSLLPRRNDSLPETVLASGTGNPEELVALQEEWYQDVVHPNLGTLLQQGVEWEAADEEGQKIQWSLRGRDLFVLSRSDSLSGFISTSRLVLGEEHIVLCADGILREVQEAILLAGSPSPVMLGVSDGIPAGWAGLKSVVPRSAVTSSAEGQILDALRPLAEVEIIMTGGIRIRRSAWLSGFPPNIRLRGDISAADEVLIDGRLASSADNGFYTTPGWDTPGEHNVWCNAGQKTYRIQEGAEEWLAWDAYSWSHGETSSEDGKPHSVICGTLVLPAKIFRGRSISVLVPKSNCVLLGAAPGEIYTCSTRLELAARYCTGDPPFQPVWALPADPLGCDRDSVSILRVGEALHPKPVSQIPARKQTTRMRSWTAAVLNACRKGLRTDPSDPAAAALWREYKRQAHVIRRSLR